ncbi:uncharacterized protein LOC113209389 isoform X2 [Frankliniella occidentalis]|uniref:Uncharacterized protein LOC113209389 isoform X2 n=1 Tax=Frankliniella occidentalis TaxID=133901 RepID=A0A6J1SPD3_FRAOC|nr:uncharacterized protein LOC113209389 isoform X2 [Frankliniella occidentalis]
MDLKCDICFLKFDLDAHRPKNLPCGHTICKECVENPSLGKKCPTCRKAFKIRRLEDLPDSFITIRHLENEDVPPRKKPRTEDPELQQLQRGADAGRKVVEMLRLVVPLAVESLNRQLESSVAQLGQVEEALERRVQREAAGDVGTPSDAVEEPLQLAEQLEASHRLLTSTKCTVAAEEEGGCAWTASVQPGGCGDILRVLLLRLRADGQLGKVDDAIAVPDGPAAAHVGPPLISVLTINDNHLHDGRLKELRVRLCTFSADGNSYHFPDLGQELAGCGLLALRRLVLVRPVNNPCTGQSPECVLQRRTIRSEFTTSVDVVCKSCHTPEF